MTRFLLRVFVLPFIATLGGIGLVGWILATPRRRPRNDIGGN